MTDVGKAQILQQIKAAEEQVRALTSQAEERRKQLQAEGKRIVIERTDRAEAELRKQLESRIAEAKARIEARKKLLLEEGAKRAGALTSDAQKRMGAAKEFVLSEFERAADA
ncbi:MAG: hypothetical protein A3K67_07670 [Euryarchaeota archaeon RBG_16_62_10]|nr:MAG: hypothetical protein A3K67_07670 [Euryarchaeota archaeon RBG_16_62_10]